MGTLGGTPDRLGPYWMERQLDPRSPAFVARGTGPVAVNVTHRNWTVVGNPVSPGTALVDPRGLVTPRAGGWSLDWWIGAEDRWHCPSREVAVRQSLLSSTPVVETAMRIPGGDAVARVYGLPALGRSGPGPVAVVEVENGSAVPVAVAFALRPYHFEGTAHVETVELAGSVVTVDGRPALLLPRPPAAMAVARSGMPDPLERVTAGLAGAEPVEVHDPAGAAQAVFVYPLPPHGTLRVALPLSGAGPEPRRGRDRRSPSTLAATEPVKLSGAGDVVRAWQAHLRRGLVIDLPDPRLQAALDANRAALLVLHEGDRIAAPETSGAPGTGNVAASPEREAQVLVALDRFGFHREVAEVLLAAVAARPSGAAAGPLLFAIAEHHRLTGDTGLLSELLPGVARLTAALARSTGIGPPSGTLRRSYAADFWSLRGLADGAALLRLAGDGVGARRADAAAAALQVTLNGALGRDAARLGGAVMPSVPGGMLEAAMTDSLVAGVPLGLLAPGDRWLAGTIEAIQGRFCVDDAVYDGAVRTGLATELTLRLAACEADAGDARALRRLRWLLDVATPTFTWPEAVHPRLGSGCHGAGHHAGTTAAFVDLVRRIAVRETPACREAPGGGLALCSVFPPEWAGQILEVTDAPTHHGRISYALRWHGDHPALLWQCERGVRLTAPGLDPCFRSDEQSGEALLAPYRVRVPIAIEDAGS